jgi:hypothetical protein
MSVCSVVFVLPSDRRGSSKCVCLRRNACPWLLEVDACTGRTFSGFNARFWWGKLKERDPLEDVSVDEMIILKWVGRTWLMWLRIGTGGRLLWTVGIREMRGIA